MSRLADDRANQLSDDLVEEEIKKRLKKHSATRGDFAKVHPCLGSADIPDETETRLVVLGPDHPHTAKQADSPARQEAAAILEARGASPRNYKNTLVFLAADANRSFLLNVSRNSKSRSTSFLADTIRPGANSSSFFEIGEHLVLHYYRGHNERRGIGHEERTHQRGVAATQPVGNGHGS